MAGQAVQGDADAGDDHAADVIFLVVHNRGRRLGNLKDRGVVLKEGQTLKGLYEERTPLYEKYAQLTVDEETLGIRETVELVAEALKKE